MAMEPRYPRSAAVEHRISLRRMLCGAAAVGLATAATGMVACRRSSPGRSGSASHAAPGALDSARGKPGGSFKFMLAGFPNNFSITEGINSYNQVGYFHSALLAQAWGQESV